MQVRLFQIPRGKWFFYPAGQGFYRLYIRGPYEHFSRSYICFDLHTGKQVRFPNNSLVNRCTC